MYGYIAFLIPISFCLEIKPDECYITQERIPSGAALSTALNSGYEDASFPDK